jgi:glycosyltransferase involved in cell wall biosynthesis
MKIFVVCSRLGYGGAEHVAVMWANGFVERGHDVTLISNLYEEITFKIDERVRVRNLISSVDSKTKKWGGAVKNLRKLAKETQPDVIISVMRVCSVIAKLAVIGLNIPVIATEHNAYEWPECHPMPFQARFFKFRLSKFYKAVTVLTEADKLVIGTRLKNAVVIPNPHILDPLNESTSRENILLAVGRLDAWQVKGFDVLIKAFSKLVQGSLKPSSEELIVNSEGWKLQIAGTGSEKSLNYLKGLCQENGVEDYVEFLGFQKNIEKLYQKASIFVLSSRYEGFGLVLIEAMSQGCACIACDYKGRQREIIQNDSQGLCCEPDDVDALAEVMRKMITDDEYRESIRNNAVERSKYYSLDNIMGKWEALLSKVVNK